MTNNVTCPMLLQILTGGLWVFTLYYTSCTTRRILKHCCKLKKYHMTFANPSCSEDIKAFWSGCGSPGFIRRTDIFNKNNAWGAPPPRLGDACSPAAMHGPDIARSAGNRLNQHCVRSFGLNVMDVHKYVKVQQSSFKETSFWNKKYNPDNVSCSKIK